MDVSYVLSIGLWNHCRLSAANRSLYHQGNADARERIHPSE